MSRILKDLGPPRWRRCCRATAPRVEAMVNNRVRGQGSAGELRVYAGGMEGGNAGWRMAGLTGWWPGNHGAP